MQPLDVDQPIGATKPEIVPYGRRHVSPPEKRRRVQEHFDAIAGRYDVAYVLLSFGLYWWWRKQCLVDLNLKPGDILLDLCGGTGDLARTAARTHGTMVVVCDLNRPMMDAGRSRTGFVKGIQWVHGNAEDLGFAEGVFDALFIGLGLRNLVRIQCGLQEMLRVLKDGGRLVILEFSVPPSPVMKTFYRWYSARIMPILGRFVTGTHAPFRYLAESVEVFPEPEWVSLTLNKIGFTDVSFQRLSKGLVTLYRAKKAATDNRAVPRFP